jgi:glycosyltransferase involved in cell wall biosynthesis
MTHASADCDLSFVLRCCDDEERIGHAIQRLSAHLRGMGLKFELLLVDEGSVDNTLAVAALLRSRHPELTVLHASAGQGYVLGAERARGRIVVAADVRTDAPLATLGYALGRVERGLDVVALGGRFLVFRRTRSLRALDALAVTRRDARTVERRFVRRARSLGLGAAVTHGGPRSSVASRMIARFLGSSMLLQRPLSFLL